MRTLLLILAGLAMAQVSGVATNDLPSVRTNFASGSTLSSSELDTVVRLANLCGIQKVVEVSTELHLSGTTILVAGDEKFEGRSVSFKTLRVYPSESRLVRPAGSLSVGQFWTVKWSVLEE